VAKHTGGFCWWQTDTSKYSIKNTPWRGGKGDVVAELARSCCKGGLKLAIYVYPGDDNWGAYIGGGKTRDPKKQEAYNKVYRRQLTEVLTRYGPISELKGKIHGAKWADGKYGKALDFDGKDDYVSLGKADVYGSDFTVTAWIRPRSFAPVGGTIISKERTSLSDFNLRLYVVPGGRLGFWITDDMRNNIWPFETAPGSIPANRWTFVAARRSGTTHTLYIDGKPVASKRSKVVIRHGSDPPC
jgi:hypothetical protein